MGIKSLRNQTGMFVYFVCFAGIFGYLLFFLGTTNTLKLISETFCI